MNPMKLNCPACGGSLELPGNLTAAHCVYCGNKIILDPKGVIEEGHDLQRFVELCDVAVSAKNHGDVIRYCNLILEIEPKNVDAWLNKAASTFMLTTGASNRYDEAMEYLNRASIIAPNDHRVAETSMNLTRQQANWYNYLGNEQLESARRIYNIYGGWTGGERESSEQALEAMKFYLLASFYAPEDITILENIEFVAKRYTSLNWGETVRMKILVLKAMREKKSAEAKIPELRLELEKANVRLGQLKLQKGFLVSKKIKDTEHRIIGLQTEINQLEKLASFIPTEPSFDHKKVRTNPL